MKQWISTLTFILAAASIHAHGAELSRVAPVKSPAQKEFAKLLDQKQFTEALMAWNSAYSKTTFAKTDTGIALQGYLMAKSGLPLFGAHWIVADTNLKHISKNLRAEVIPLIKANSSLLSSAQADTSWKFFLDDQDTIRISSRKDLNRVYKKLKATKKSDVEARAKYYWALSVGAAKLNDTRLAEVYIRDLKGLNQNLITADKIEMQLARVLFQKSKLSEAIDSYSLIPKSSEFWLESIEERAWAYLRLGNYDKARGDITTLLAPTFKDYTTAEVYVLAAITNLRICDYPQILKDGRQFKTTHMERIKEMELLAENGVNTNIKQILDQMDESGARLSAAAGKLASLPRLALRDPDFYLAVNKRAELLKEIKVSRSVSDRLSVMGGNGALAKLIEWAGWETQNLRTKSLRELKSLATAEVKDYRVNINKMKLAEVEVIHHINVDDSLKGKRGNLGPLSQGRDTLVFPYDKEVWVDELDNYQAQVKDCPTTQGASL